MPTLSASRNIDLYTSKSLKPVELCCPAIQDLLGQKIPQKIDKLANTQLMQNFLRNNPEFQGKQVYLQISKDTITINGENTNFAILPANDLEKKQLEKIIRKAKKIYDNHSHTKTEDKIASPLSTRKVEIVDPEEEPLKTKKERLKGLQEQIEPLQNKIRDLEEQLNLQKETSDSLTEQAANSMVDLRLANKEKNVLQKHIKDLKNKIDDLELESNLAAIKKSEELNTLNSEKETLNREKNILQDQISSSQLKNNEKINNLENLFENAAKERLVLLKEIEEKNEEIENLKNSAQILSQEYGNKVLKSDDEIRELVEQKKSLEQKFNSEKANLEKALKGQEVRNGELQLERNKLLAEKNAFALQLQNLEKDTLNVSQQRENEIAKLKNQTQLLEEKIQIQEGAIAKVETEKREFLEQLERLKSSQLAQIGNLNKQIQNLQKAFDQAKANHAEKLKELNAEKNKLQSQNKGLHKEVEKLNNVILALSDQIKQKNVEIENLKNSAKILSQEFDQKVLKSNDEIREFVAQKKSLEQEFTSEKATLEETLKEQEARSAELQEKRNILLEEKAGLILKLQDLENEISNLKEKVQNYQAVYSLGNETIQKLWKSLEEEKAMNAFSHQITIPELKKENEGKDEIITDQDEIIKGQDQIILQQEKLIEDLQREIAQLEEINKIAYSKEIANLQEQVKNTKEVIEKLSKENSELAKFQNLQRNIQNFTDKIQQNPGLKFKIKEQYKTSLDVNRKILKLPRITDATPANFTSPFERKTYEEMVGFIKKNDPVKVPNGYKNWKTSTHKRVFDFIYSLIDTMTTLNLKSQIIDQDIQNLLCSNKFPTYAKELMQFETLIVKLEKEAKKDKKTAGTEEYKNLQQYKPFISGLKNQLMLLLDLLSANDQIEYVKA
ncbi:MAG: hypothetical protein L0207_01775 [Chlamydiae bacterium]|nr:hypothetical protein [Chlamydiota bacterium]